MVGRREGLHVSTYITRALAQRERLIRDVAAAWCRAEA